MQHLMAHVDQLRTLHEIAKPTQRCDRDLATFGDALRERLRARTRLSHRHHVACISGNLSPMRLFTTSQTDTFRKVVNLAVLLQTLDTNGDHTDGIEISSEVSALFEGSSFALDQPRTAFQADTELRAAIDEANRRSLFSETRTLVEPEDALRALYLGIGLCSPGP